MSRLQDIKEKEAKRILGKESVTREEIEKVFEIYGTYDFFNEYLVEGAVLTCEQSTKKPIKITVDNEVMDFNVSENGITAGSAPVDKDKVLGKLIVTQTKKAKISEQRNATVIDYCFKRNIPCFGNCKKEQYNEKEKKKLKEGDDTQGTCRYLIDIKEEWEDDNLLKSPLQFDTIDGIKDGITLTNMLFCARGGWIYPVISGQETYNIKEAKKFAMSMMDTYLSGWLSETEVEKAIRYLSLVLPEIASVEEKEAEDEWEKEWAEYWRDDKFDPYIKAWTYYWNQKIEEELLYKGSKTVIRPEVVKAIIMEESSWGKGTNMNASRDVMQALHPGDYGLWILSGYNPDIRGMYHRGNDELRVVWIKDGRDYKNASMRAEFHYYAHGDEKTPPDHRITTTEQAELGNGLGVLRENVVTVITGEESKEIRKSDAWINQEIKESPAGEYLIHYDRVTPNMGIACGVRYLVYHTEKAGCSELKGVRGYNGDGKESKTGIKDAYVKDINMHLDHLVTSDGKPVKELQQ